jgi:adenylate cyclase
MQIVGVRQARIHRKVGERLESGYAERTQEIAATLAAHFDRGHEIERCLHYRKLAAEQAMNRHAYPSAIEQFGKALDKLGTLPETVERNQQELDILLNLNAVRVATSGYIGMQLEQGYNRAQALCELLNDPLRQFTVLWNIAGFRMARGELSKSRALIEQAAALTHDLNDEGIDLMTDIAYAQQLLFEGAFAGALDQADSVVSRYDIERHATLASTYSQEDPGVTCAAIACLASWKLGYTEQARDRLQVLQHLSTQLNNPPRTALGLVLCCMACQLHGDPQAMLERADELIELSNRYAVHWLPVARVFRAWAMFKLKPVPEQLEIARNCLGEWRESGVTLSAAYYLGLVVEMQCVLGELDQAQASMIEALALVENNGEYWIESGLRRLQGELMLAQDSKLHQEAEACFTRSLEVARAQQARSLELRAALSLSQLWMQQGNSNEARQLLQPIIEWFGDTANSPDLRNARILIA